MSTNLAAKSVVRHGATASWEFISNYSFFALVARGALALPASPGKVGYFVKSGKYARIVKTFLALGRVVRQKGRLREL